MAGGYVIFVEALVVVDAILCHHSFSEEKRKNAKYFLSDGWFLTSFV